MTLDDFKLIEAGYKLGFSFTPLSDLESHLDQQFRRANR